MILIDHESFVKKNPKNCEMTTACAAMMVALENKDKIVELKNKDKIGLIKDYVMSYILFFDTLKQIKHAQNTYKIKKKHKTQNNVFDSYFVICLAKQT